MVVIPEDADGHVDLGHLEEELVRHRDRPLKIGSFSAASNVTGIITDWRAIATLLHEHGALSFWDFAAAAPYVRIDMAEAGLDAIFVSPHKFIGGPGTPGLLVARKDLFQNRVPSVPGRRNRRLRQPGRARLPGRRRASRGGRHAGDRRVDPGRPRLPAQGGGRRGGDPRPRGVLHPAGDRTLAPPPQHRDPRQPRPRPAVDRVLRGPPQGGRPRAGFAEHGRQGGCPPRKGRSLSAPQLRRRAPQRPLRDPVARRLLLRRALRPPAARHRPRALPRVRAGDRPRLRGESSRAGSG